MFLDFSHMQKFAKRKVSKELYFCRFHFCHIVSAVIYENRESQISSFLLITMDEELYDEFGNYIGPEINDSEDESLSVGNHHPKRSPYI